jgi:hypothetical protein
MRQVVIRETQTYLLGEVGDLDQGDETIVGVDGKVSVGVVCGCRE